MIKKLSDIHYEPITSVKTSGCGCYILTNSLDSRLQLVDTRMFNVVTTFEDNSYRNGYNSNEAAISSNS